MSTPLCQHPRRAVDNLAVFVNTNNCRHKPIWSRTSTHNPLVCMKLVATLRADSGTHRYR